MLGVLPFVEDPDLSGSAAPTLPQHLPPCRQMYFANVHLSWLPTVNQEHKTGWRKKEGFGNWADTHQRMSSIIWAWALGLGEIFKVKIKL